MEETEEEQFRSMFQRRQYEGSPVMQAKFMLSESPRDPKKAEERRKLLTEHPEAKISVDCAQLHGIIPYLSLKCHPDCSVARDEAINGSDFDGGLVVLSDPVVSKKQLQFVDALRSQGFDVYHPSELSAAERKYRGAQSDEERREASSKMAKMTGKTIEFRTKSDLDKMVSRGVHDLTVNVYLAGADVA